MKWEKHCRLSLYRKMCHGWFIIEVTQYMENTSPFSKSALLLKFSTGGGGELEVAKQNGRAHQYSNQLGRKKAEARKQ
jgi:hypothetical protein